MATEAVTDHVVLARKFLQWSKEYLGEGDLHQASEKGWGAASHIIKAVAAREGWEYSIHDDFGVVVRNARQRYRQPSLSRMSYAAQELHRNYYKRDLLLDSDEIEEQLEEVERMVDVLQPFAERE